MGGIQKASEFLDKLLYYFFGEEETSNLCSSAAESVFILLLRSFSKGDSGWLLLAVYTVGVVKFRQILPN